MSRRDRRRQPNRSATRRGPGPRRTRPEEDLGPEAQPLIQGIRETLRDEDRLAVVRMVSSMVVALDSPRDDSDGEPDDSGPTVAEFAETFMGVDIAETTVVLNILRALTADELLVARIDRVLPTRRQPVPSYLQDLARISVDRAAYIGDDLGDGENVILSVRWPTDPGATVVAYIDHAIGTRVKDVMVIDLPVEDVLDRYRELMSAEGRPDEIEAMATADARATIADALEQGDANDLVDFSAEEDDTIDWPMPRPIVEALLRRMPPGGRVVSDWSNREEVTVEEVHADFVASPEGRAAGADSSEVVSDAARLLIQCAETFAGHPLRWSPRTLEVALVEELPYDPVSEDAVLDAVPDVVPELVAYSQHRAGLDPEGIMETRAAMPVIIEEFLRQRDSDSVRELRRLEPAIEAMVAGDMRPMMRHHLLTRFGSQEVVDALTDEPLPAEPLQISAVPEDVRATVTEISDWVDRWIDESEDAQALGEEAEELRTACRRFLVTTAVQGPAVMRRRARADYTALAVLWTLGRDSGLIGYSPAPVRSHRLQEWFGAGSMPSGRAESLVTAFTGGSTAEDGLSDPRVLTSRGRTAIVAMRERSREDAPGDLAE